MKILTITVATIVFLGEIHAGSAPAFPQAWPAGSEKPDPAEIFQHGQEALAKNDLDAAEADFRKVLSLNPRSATAYANLGVVEMRRQNWDKALAHFSAAEKLAPRMTGVRLDIGIVEYRRANYAAAIAPLTSVLREEPHSTQARFLLGFCYSFTGRFADAANPNLPFLHFNMGMAYFRMGKTESAESEFRKDIALEPDMAYNYEQLALLHLQQAREADAERELQEALKREPRLPTSLLELAKLYQHRGDNAQALRLLDSAVSLAPDNQNVHFARGQVLLKLGRKEESRKELAIAQKLIDAGLNKDRAAMQEILVPNPELAQQP